MDFGLKSLHVVKKCGFRMVFERDIEGIREMMAQSNKSSCIVPPEGLSSHAMPISHNLENPTLRLRHRTHIKQDLWDSFVQSAKVYAWPSSRTSDPAH